MEMNDLSSLPPPFFLCFPLFLSLLSIAALSLSHTTPAQPLMSSFLSDQLNAFSCNRRFLHFGNCFTAIHSRVSCSLTSVTTLSLRSQVLARGCVRAGDHFSLSLSPLTADQKQGDRRPSGDRLSGISFNLWKPCLPSLL